MTERLLGLVFKKSLVTTRGKNDPVKEATKVSSNCEEVKQEVYR